MRQISGISRLFDVSVSVTKLVWSSWRWRRFIWNWLRFIIWDTVFQDILRKTLIRRNIYFYFIEVDQTRNEGVRVDWKKLVNVEMFKGCLFGTNANFFLFCMDWIATLLQRMGYFNELRFSLTHEKSLVSHTKHWTIFETVDELIL